MAYTMYFQVLCVIACLTYGRFAEAEDSSEPQHDCPEGWEKYSDADHSFCIYFSTEEAEYDEAADNCEELGGLLAYPLPPSDNMKFIKEKLNEHGHSYWVGMKREKGPRSKYFWSDGREMGRRERPLRRRDSRLLKPKTMDMCTVWMENTPKWQISKCDSKYRYICQKGSVCETNRFGDQCERECHCLGTPCVFDSLVSKMATCENGCQRGWFGLACENVRRQPKVNYWCTNTPEAVHMAVVTNGFEQINVYYQDDSNSYERCSETRNWDSDTTEKFNQIVIKRSPSAQSGDMSLPQTHVCDQDSIDRWIIEFREKPHARLEYDSQTVVACNFSQAGQFQVQEDFGLQVAYTVDSELPKATLESVEGDISLTLIKYEDGEEIGASSPVGTPVVLRLKYGLKEGSLVKGVLPKNCYVMPRESTDVSPDEIIQFVDESGCLVDPSPIPAFVQKDNHTLETGWFPLFDVNYETALRVQCSYTLCFKPEEECASELDCS